MTAACAAGRCVRPSWDVDGVRVPLCWAHWTAATPEARMGWWREHGHRDGAIGPVEQGEPSPALLGLLASIDGPEDRYRGQRLDEASGDWRRTAGEGGTRARLALPAGDPLRVLVTGRGTAAGSRVRGALAELVAGGGTPGTIRHLATRAHDGAWLAASEVDGEAARWARLHRVAVEAVDVDTPPHEAMDGVDVAILVWNGSCPRVALLVAWALARGVPVWLVSASAGTIRRGDL